MKNGRAPPKDESQPEYEEETDELSCEDLKCEDLKNLPKYDKAIIKGFMRGFGKAMILWLINRERMHGYEVMTKLNEFFPSENKKKVPGPSMVYPVLHNLEKRGLIKGTWESQGKRKVKYYEITEEGAGTIMRIKLIFKCHIMPHCEEFWNDMFLKNKE
jgi:PadR family transcriptional regulator, regulatory protein PadR